MFSTVSTLQKDTEIIPGAGDSYSDVSFSPVNDMIAATSWDNQVMSINLILAASLGRSTLWNGGCKSSYYA